MLIMGVAKCQSCWTVWPVRGRKPISDCVITMGGETMTVTTEKTLVCSVKEVGHTVCNFY